MLQLDCTYGVIDLTTTPEVEVSATKTSTE